MSVYEYKQQADTAYKHKDYDTAVALYTKALEQAPNDLRLWANRAQTFLQLKRWTEVLEDCTKILKQDPTHVKALFRRGQAYIQLGETEAAQKDWKHVKTLQPENQTIIKALNDLEGNITKINQEMQDGESITYLRTPIFIKEVETLPLWAQNELEHTVDEQLEFESWNKLNMPTLQMLKQEIRVKSNTEIAQHNRLMHFFSIDAMILPRLFGSAGLEGIFLETFLQAIKHAYYHMKDRTAWWKQSLSLLEQLSVCARFNIAILFVKKDTLKQLDQLFQQATIEADGQPYQMIWKVWMELGK
ncbi:hypothetical protein PCANB_000451 [Pneumocystis canis]|nr:hypothetical protein PCK1_000503 [Pneumocystis canis]KAG5437738.1 hypothetical protein PCANB_000451 [Pneumocystis canis]